MILPSPHLQSLPGSQVKVLFAPGSLSQIATLAQSLSAQRILLVTDPGIMATGHPDRALRAFYHAGLVVRVFDQVIENPTSITVGKGVILALPFKPDLIVGLGGGSSMDTAKGINFLLTNGGQMKDYHGTNKATKPLLPMIAIPTTAGTGSEVSAAAVFTDTANHIKVSCLSPFLRPAFAIVDPMFTVSCPPKVTADSGIDALTHAIEGFCAVDNDEFPLPSGEKSVYQGKNPLADAMAREAIMRVGQSLRRAVEDGNDLEAREEMALAATLGGLAFSNAGVALVHAMEYPVGGAVHVSHGAGNGLLLPFVMRFNLPKRIAITAEIGWLLGNRAETVRTGDKWPELAEEAIRTIEQLRKDIGIPTRLRDIGVKEEMLPGFAAKAFAIKRLMRVNPRMPQSEEEILGIYKAAF
jgi:alcohol dehydrogenase class IV